MLDEIGGLRVFFSDVKKFGFLFDLLDEGLGCSDGIWRFRV